MQLGRSFVVCALTVVAGCAAVPDRSDRSQYEDIGDRSADDSQSIINGTVATAFPEAVLVDLKKGGQLVGYCSGAIIAPRVVLTAGHCVYGYDGWSVTAPYANGQKAQSQKGLVYDYATTSESVPTNQHDVGLVVLSSAISLTSYPTLAASAVTSSQKIVNIGRIRNGSLSSSNLYVSKQLSVTGGAAVGYPYDYSAAEIIESGDSGGPDILAGTHKIVAVNSGAGGGSEVLARVDLVGTWIGNTIAANGGNGSGGANNPPPPPPPPPPSCVHDKCNAGAKLAQACDACVTQICAADSYCCSSSWDAQCVSEVSTICHSSACASNAATLCQQIGYAGSCSGSTLQYCDSSLHTIDCASQGATCAWDATNEYYNCM